MRLEDVAGVAAGLIPRSARVDVVDNRDGGAVLCYCSLKSFDAILDASAFGLVDDRDAPASAQGLTDQGAGLITSLHVVAGDVRDDLALFARTRDVRGKDWNARRVGLGDRAADRLRIVRRENDGVDTLRYKIFYLALLLGIVAAGIDDGERVAVFRGRGSHARFHVLVELRLTILNRDADRLVTRTGRARRRRCGGLRRS